VAYFHSKKYAAAKVFDWQIQHVIFIVNFNPSKGP